MWVYIFRFYETSEMTFRAKKTKRAGSTVMSSTGAHTSPSTESAAVGRRVRRWSDGRPAPISNRTGCRATHRIRCGSAALCGSPQPH